MYKQMDIFDFLGESAESGCLPTQKLFEQLFEKEERPVAQCTNCLCKYCVNNVEDVWHTVKPVEVQKSCFNCDECRIFDVDYGVRIQRKEECADFVISDHGAQRNRKKCFLPKQSS